MGSGIFGIGATALTAAQSGILTTQRNIANASNPTYHRQRTDQITTLPSTSGAGFVGNGVNLLGVGRAYDRFLENELLFSQGQLTRHETYASYAGQVDAVLGDANSGLATTLERFFAAVNEVANAPTSGAARQTLLTSGANLVGRLDNLNGLLQGMQQSANQQIQDIATQVTGYSRAIAEINGRIDAVQSASGDAAANELRDQRDALAAEINRLVGASVVIQADGSYNVFVGSGQMLVAGSNANGLSAVADPADPTMMLPAVRVGGANVILDSRQVSGGKLGGLLAFREEMLVPTQRQLGAIAVALTTGFNAQHVAGFDLNGVAGGDFFTVPDLRNPVANRFNTGNGELTVAVTDPDLLVNSDFRLGYDGTNVTLTRVSDGTSYSATGVDQPTAIANLNAIVSSAAGMSFSLVSGTLNAGDTYLVRPTQFAAGGLKVALNDPSEIAAAASANPGDNENALALAGLRDARLLGNGTSTLQTAFSQIVSRNATLANGVDINVRAYDALSRQATTAQQAISGVNLDEEAANLIRYQQAYQAAARSIQVASSLFDEILAIVR